MNHVLAVAEKPTVVINGELFSPANSFPTIGSLINVILQNALTIAGLICLILLIFGGFGFIVSAGGDAKKMEKGKQTITSALTGLVLIIAAYWIIQIISIVTGVNILKPNL